jgi:RNA polymerase sigma-70 factor (ECF subfamily)
MSVSVLTGGRLAALDTARPTISEVERQKKGTRGGDAPGSTVQMTSSDEELVARSAGGDLDSFNQLVVRWERPIYALAYRVIGREEEARDVVQEAFLRAYRSLGGFRGQAKFSSWLYRITLNLCRDWIRRHRRAPFVETPEGVDVIELAGEHGASESVEDLVARKDLGAFVSRALDALTEDQRTAIVLKEYQGLTFQEIADLLGCPLSTVKTRLYQGLVVLRRELEQQGITAEVVYPQARPPSRMEARRR